ncbi:MAG: hypothetical protein HY052_05740 [Proteobacteria bacterium]|nr:hypothetical protein [Pseudomonadota bacterium]
MKHPSNSYREHVESKLKDILGDFVVAVVQEINSKPGCSSATPEKSFTISTKCLQTLVDQYCIEDVGNKSMFPYFKIDIKAMKDDSKLRGFEEKLFPLLDGLFERGGKVDHQKIMFAVDKADFREDSKPTQERPRNNPRPR